MKHMTAAVVVVALLAGCRREGPLSALSCSLNITPVSEILGTAVPLAYAATMAMAAMKQRDIPCVSVTLECASYPCSGSVTIALDQNCVLPLGSVGNGAIVVSGTWTSEDEANLVAVYEGIRIDGASLWVRQGAFAALVSGDTITMTYADQSVALASETEMNIDQSAWTVRVRTMGTLGNPDDDEMRIFGMRQYAGTSGVSEVALIDVTYNPYCRRNPGGGTATMLAFGESSPAQLSFHSACDGAVDVVWALSPGCIGTSIPLELLR